MIDLRPASDSDLPLLCLAVTMCALGAFATAVSGRFAVVGPRSQRAPWMVLAVVAATCAVWASCVLTMLAVRVEPPRRYDPRLLATAFGVGLLMMAIAAQALERLERRPVVGGVAGGIAIAVMHATATRAMCVAGQVDWHPERMAIAAVLTVAATTGAAVLWRRSRESNPLPPIALFVFATCGGGWVSTAAATFVARPGATWPPDAIDETTLGSVVAAMAVVLAGLALFAHTMSRRHRVRRAIEREQLQMLGDVAVEGLALCEGPRIVWINRSLETMLAGSKADLVGLPLATLLQGPPPDELPTDCEIDARLRTGHQDRHTDVPVRVIARPIRIAERPHRVVAIRDQRERLRAEAAMERLANSDVLTGLANRGRFNALLAAAFARRADDAATDAATDDFGLLAFDLDRFKTVNDTHGHAAGDAVLVEVAARLASLVRQGDLVARVGGDEFAILVVTDCAADAVTSLASRAVEAIMQPFVVEGRLHRIGASIGIAIARRDGDDAETLTRNADLALYAAKAAGRGRYRVFEQGMRVASQERHALEEALRAAVARNEFRLHFQPQVDARTGRFNGAEALVRWMHPVAGLLQPAAFIDLAEETDLIVSLGEWVLRDACREAATWPDELVVAVNLSPTQLAHPGLVAVVASALATAGLPGRRLELEVTESVLIADSPVVGASLVGLKALGVRLALDDFGTGYSSLGHLHRFPFDKIKIDRSFISRVPAEADSVAIVHAVVALGSGLGMTTSAEGVETEEQRRFVVDAGCDQIQGYLVGRAVAASALPEAFRQPAPAERVASVAQDTRRSDARRRTVDG